MLGQPGRAGELLARAEAVVHNCCGSMSPPMEPVLQERAWLAAATRGEAASIPYPEQLRELRISVYGARSQEAEQNTLDIAKAKGQADR